MKVIYLSLVEFLEQLQQLTIPIYQRKYSWERKQCQQLLKDIENIGNSNKESHFVGSIVFQSYREKITKLTIIDGQQRITTMSLLMAALSNYLVKNPEIEEKIDLEAESVLTDFLFNSTKKGDLRYKLVLTEDDDTTYKKIVNNVSSKDKIEFNDNDSDKLYKTYEYFSNKINENNVESIWEGINKLSVVTLDLENTDSPQAIFESLNSTGKELNSTDLIRNFLLMDLTPTEQNYIYNTYWHEIELIFEKSKESFDDFIKHYLTLKYNTVITGDIYTRFKEFTEYFDSVEDLVKDVYKYAQHFIKIVLGKEPDKKLNRAFKSFNLLPYKVIRPFLLKLYDDYVAEKLSAEDFVKIMEYTESYSFRRYICDRDSQSLRVIYAAMYNELDIENCLDSYKYILSSKQGKHSMPNDDEFEIGFTTIDAYHSKINKYILLKLTNFKSNELTKMEDCDIEHIMPQNPKVSKEWKEELGDDWEEIHKTYLHNIGNLTLTGSNSKLGDKSFTEKKTMSGGFNDSTINLNTYFREIEHWNKKEIINRSVFLSNQAKEIWPYPNVSSDIENKYKNKEKSVNLDDFKLEQPKNRNFEYWTQCKEEIDKNYPNFKSRKPTTSNWYDLAIGSSLAHISLTINSFTNEIKSQIWINENKELFDYLSLQKDDIESILGFEMIWNRLDDKKASAIFIAKEVELGDDWKWDEYIKWQLDIAEKLYNAFSDRIKNFIKEGLND